MNWFPFAVRKHELAFMPSGSLPTATRKVFAVTFRRQGRLPARPVSAGIPLMLLLSVWGFSVGCLRAQDRLGPIATAADFVPASPPTSDASLIRQKAEARKAAAMALRAPMAAGRDVAPALTAWFAAGKQRDPKRALAGYQQVVKILQRGKLPFLPQAKWPASPRNVTFRLLERFSLQDCPGIVFQIVGFKVTGIQEYGVLIYPARKGQYPLIVYAHGAAYGVPVYSLPWLGDIAARGYTIAAVAFRGESLFTRPVFDGKREPYRCGGRIENLLGEPEDVLAMADAAFKMDFVKKGKFAILGHSFGAGAGLLAAARSDQVSVVISYDAWLVNPFRFYWERLRGGSKYYWESWEAYCQRQSVPDQLKGLMARSIVHHVDRLSAPILLFVGALDGPAYRTCHDELAARLKQAGKTVHYEVVPDGGHNFVLYYESKPARYAYKIQMQWLKRYQPPTAPASPTLPPPDFGK